MKQVCYRKIKSGAFAGDVFAIFPEYRNGEVACFDPVGGFGSMSLEYFTDCTEDATPEESAAVREVWENLYNSFKDIQSPDAGLEEISFSDFMRIIFPERENAESKRDAYSAGSPEANFAMYYGDLEKLIIKDGYTPKTTMENLISMVILHFDSADNYGEYDPESGFGGYGDEFTLDECVRYVSESGGWAEFDYYC